MRLKIFLGFFLILLGASPAFCANSLQAGIPKALLPIEKSFKVFASQPYFQVKLQAGFRQGKSVMRAVVKFSVQKKPVEVLGNANFRADFQGAAVSFAGQEGYFNKVLYFRATQSPFAKPDTLNRWFGMDFGEMKKSFQAGAASSGQLSDITTREKASVSMLETEIQKNLPLLNRIKSQEKSAGIAGGVACRHFSVDIPVGTLLQLLVPGFSQGKGTPSPLQGLSFIPKNFSQHVDLWIGKRDGKLYRAHIPFKKEGGLDIDIAYKAQSPASSFRIPTEVTDARALGFFNMSFLPGLFPPALPSGPKEVKPIPDTTIYLEILNPYGGPSADDLKEYLGKTFGLENVEILPPAQVDQSAFNSIRQQYDAKALLSAEMNRLQAQNLATPGHYFIFLTDQDMYLPDHPEMVSPAVFSGGPATILSFNRLRSPTAGVELARAQKLLGRTLGIVYWNLPATTLPEDLMYEDFSTVPGDLDKMGSIFLDDQSLDWAGKGESETDPGKARDDFQRAIQYNPLYEKNYLLLARADYQLGDYDRCTLALHKAIAINPAGDDAFFLLGEAYEKMRRLPLAAQEYQAAALLNPKRGDAYQRLAVIYREEGDDAAAARMQKKAGETQEAPAQKN